jgi:hypothetical protein
VGVRVGVGMCVGVRVGVGMQQSTSKRTDQRSQLRGDFCVRIQTCFTPGSCSIMTHPLPCGTSTMKVFVPRGEDGSAAVHNLSQTSSSPAMIIELPTLDTKPYFGEETPKFKK